MNGWESVVLENERMRVVVLPEKGAEINALVDRDRDVDVLLRVEGAPRPDDGSFYTDRGGYARWFGGAWHGILPNGDIPCTHEGVALEHGGDLWRTAFEVAESGPSHATLSAELESLPLHVTKRLALDPGRPVLELVETVQNRSAERQTVIWGQHPIFGAPLVAPDARIEVGRCRFDVDHLDSTTTFAAGRGYEWPLAPLRDGGRRDISVIGDPSEQCHELALLHDLTDGRVAIVNDELDLGFGLCFDPKLFPWLWIWLDYGGSDEWPWQGLYAVGVEPMTGTRSVAEAVSLGTGLILEPGESRTAHFEATLFHPSAA